MLMGDEVAINAAQHPNHVIHRAELRVLALDIAWRQFGDRFDFNSIQDCGIELLPSAKSRADSDPNDHSRLVFIGLVAKSNGNRLPVVAKHISVEIRVEIQSEHICFLSSRTPNPNDLALR